MRLLIPYKKRFCFLVTIFVVCGLSACKKFVQVDPPSTQIVTASVFNNDGAAHAAMIAIYSQMFLVNSGPYGVGGESFNEAYNTGLLGDELIDISWDGGTACYTNELNAMNYSFPSNWTNPYNYIYQTNAVIEGLQNNQGVTLAVKSQLTGEAKFLRAFWYFYLVNHYGEVPLAITTDYRINNSLTRLSKEQVYDQITIDLRDATRLLNNNYVNQSDTALTSNRVRPVKAAATALLARTYLFTNKFDSAELYATEVINDGKFYLEKDLNNVFLADNPEAIWQLTVPTPNQSDIQTGDGPSFIIQGAPVPGQPYLSDYLLNSFEIGDKRRVQWIDSATDGVTTWFFPFKYQVFTNGTNTTGRKENVMMLRLAEQYLIRAEARIQKGTPDISGAVSDINIIRHRAGLGDYAGATDKNSLLMEIFHQRQDELFCEWGHRWFDMIRMNYVNGIMGAPGNVCQQKGGIWNANRYQTLFPIPQSELQRNLHLTQNPGY